MAMHYDKCEDALEKLNEAVGTLRGYYSTNIHRELGHQLFQRIDELMYIYGKED